MPRPLRRLLAVLCGVAGGLLAGELAFRALLFSDVPGLGSVAARLREPDRLAHHSEGDAYWMLRHLFGLTASDRAPGAHPEFGWFVPLFRPRDMQHADEANLGARRAVLLFGDSFTKCLTPAEDCFQGLARDLPLAERAEILNYGVGGYGFDQAQLVLDAVLARWDALLAAEPEREPPVVAVAIYLEDDLDRATMSVRGWVKPRYRLTDDGLALELPSTSSTLEHIARRGTGVRSWLWRYALHGRRWFPQVRAAQARAHQDEIRALTEALVDRIADDLEARGIEHFFVVLPGEPALRRPVWGWREPLLEEVFRARDVRFVNARRDFERDMQDSGRNPGAYFGQGAPLWGHYDALGNGVALTALLRGLAGEDDGGAPLAEAALADVARSSLTVRRARNAAAVPAERRPAGAPSAPPDRPRDPR